LRNINDEKSEETLVNLESNLSYLARKMMVPLVFKKKRHFSAADNRRKECP
jgi:hypothetical protein